MRHIIHKWFQLSVIIVVVEATNGINSSKSRKTENARTLLKRMKIIIIERKRRMRMVWVFIPSFFFIFFSSSSNFIWSIRYHLPIENEQLKNRNHATFISWTTHWITELFSLFFLMGAGGKPHFESVWQNAHHYIDLLHPGFCRVSAVHAIHLILDWILSSPALALFLYRFSYNI